MPTESFRLALLVLVLSLLGWAFALVPVLEVSFELRLSAFNLANGSLSGGQWGPIQIVIAGALVVRSAAIVWSLAEIVRAQAMKR